MCGIAGIYLKDMDNPYFNNEEMNKLIDALLIGIEPRGDDASGIATMNKEGRMNLEKADTAASKFIWWRQDIPDDIRTVMLHTRFATKGTPMNLLNNHPIQYHNSMIVHNGHISNDDELFKAEKFERKAQVDSEIIAALFNQHGFDGAQEALEKLSGNYAVAVMDRRFPEKLILAKGPTSPLVYVETRGALIWASTEKCIQDALLHAVNFETKTSDFTDLKYGEYLVIENDEMDRTFFKPYHKPYVNTTTSGYSKGKVYGSGKYSWDGWDDGYTSKSSESGYDFYTTHEQCDSCEIWVHENRLKNFGGVKICDVCCRKFNVNEEDSVVIEADQGNLLDDEHWVACELVAEQHGCSPEFVDFMLFDESQKGSEDVNLINIYMTLSDSYDDVIKVLSEDFSFLDKAVDEKECSL